MRVIATRLVFLLASVLAAAALPAGENQTELDIRQQRFHVPVS